MSKIIVPDQNSWLIKPWVDFCKILKNELNFSLWNSIEEYVKYFVNECAYLPFSESSELFLYPKFSYDPINRIAKLEKLFFVCQKARHLLTWDYSSERTKTKLNNYLFDIPPEFEDEFPGLDFFSTYNNINIFEAKETLLRCSFLRKEIIRLIVIENQSEGYVEDVLNKAIIKYDLSFLKECHFFNSIKNKTFKSLLPPNLMIEIPIDLDIDVKKVPDKLKYQQLINFNKI